MPRRRRNFVDETIIAHDDPLFSSDERSVSSTIDTNKPCPLLHAEKTSNPRRRVTFNEGANVSYVNHTVSLDDIPSLWYRNSDFKRFKTNNKISAKRIAQMEQENEHNADSYGNVLRRLHDACNCPKASNETLLDSSDYKKLRKLVSNHYARVGTEKLSIYALLEGKKVRRRLVVDTVLLVEEEHSPNTYFASSLIEKRERAIADAAQAISRFSALFAVVLAQAHYCYRPMETVNRQ